MRRIVWWVVTTATALVLLLGYHTSTAGALRAVSSVSAPAITGGTSGSGGGSSGGSSSSGNSGGSGSSGKSAGQSVTGPAVSTQWGPVQVEITVANGTITDVAVLQYPNGNGRDAEINAYALPILVKETLSAQSADIDMVSGATVTSVGYQSSLQAALDQAGL